MAGQKTIIHTQADKDRFCTFLSGLGLDQPVEIKWQKWSPKRSLSANALYWVWLTKLTEFFNQKLIGASVESGAGHVTFFDREGMHYLMKHKFLGYETKRLRVSVIEGQLRSTRKLSRAEFCEYLTKIDAYAQSHDCFLERPQDSEYARYLEQNA